MAEIAGKLFLVKLATTYNGTSTYTTVGAVKSLKLSNAKSQVDVTTKGSAGLTNLLAGGGKKTTSIEFDGIVNTGDAGQDLLQDAYDASTHWNAQITNGTTTWTFTVHVDSLDFSGGFEDVMTFASKWTVDGTVTIS